MTCTCQDSFREIDFGGVFISLCPFFTLVQPRNAEELLGMLDLGNLNRTQHPTEANATSSRSHAVFQVYVHRKPRTAGIQTQVCVCVCVCV